MSTATYTGYYIDPYILTYPPNHKFTTATGWDLKNIQYNKANNYGFLADREFSFNPSAIGLVGDSFVEANMLPGKSRLASQLELNLGGRPVFALGGPGSSILDYAERIRFAHETFGIDEFIVVLERSDLKQALCGSGHNHGPCLDPQTLEKKIQLQTNAGLVKRILRESALAQYLFSQLKINPTLSFIKIFEKPPTSISQAPASPPIDIIADTVTKTFFKKIKFERKIHITFLIDAERARLFSDLAQENIELSIFQKIVRREGGRIILTVTAFREYKEKTGLALEVGPQDFHWNPEAIKIIAKLLLQNNQSIYLKY